MTAADPALAPGTDQDLRALFGRSIAVFAALAGPEHLAETANPAFFAAIGEDRARTGLALAELMPELAGRGVLTARAHAPGARRGLLLHPRTAAGRRRHRDRHPDHRHRDPPGQARATADGRT